jgi:hypothetical protein
MVRAKDFKQLHIKIGFLLPRLLFDYEQIEEGDLLGRAFDTHTTNGTKNI